MLNEFKSYTVSNEILTGVQRNKAFSGMAIAKVRLESGKISQDSFGSLKDNRIQFNSSSIWVKKEREISEFGFPFPPRGDETNGILLLERC